METNTTYDYIGREYKRGEVYYIDYNSFEATDSEQKGGRPCVIVSSSLGCLTSPNLLVVLLTRQSRENMSVHVPVYATGEKSYAICEQPRPISKRKFLQYKGKCSEEEMRNIDESLITVFGIEYLKVQYPGKSSWTKELISITEHMTAKCMEYDTLVKNLADSNTMELSLNGMERYLSDEVKQELYASISRSLQENAKKMLVELHKYVLSNVQLQLQKIHSAESVIELPQPKLLKNSIDDINAHEFTSKEEKEQKLESIRSSIIQESKKTSKIDPLANRSDIIKALNNGVKASELAKKYKCSVPDIYKIRGGKK